jgi:hypothetical protein
MSVRVTCKTCHHKFTRPTGSNRLNCEKCKPPRVIAPAVPEASPTDAPQSPGPVEAATRAELERAQRLGSVAGQVAVRLARDLDSAALTGSQASSLGAQLMRTMAIATDGAPALPDEIDEFTRRANEKRASA